MTAQADCPSRRREASTRAKPFDWREYFERSSGATASVSIQYCANATIFTKTYWNAASFPLVPYVNRIRGGQFRVSRARGPARRRTWPATPARCTARAGWRRGRCRERSDTRRDAVASITTGEWPWAYEARQDFALDEHGLSLRLTCRNLSDEPMPCGLGQHPYFNCGPETRLDTDVTHAWTIDEHVLPVDESAGRTALRSRATGWFAGRASITASAAGAGRARLSDPAWPFDLELSLAGRAILPALFAAPAAASSSPSR